MMPDGQDKETTTRLVQPQTRPYLETLEVVRRRRREGQLFAKVVDLDLFRYRIVPMKDLFIKLFKVLALKITNEGRLKIIDQFPDLGSKSRIRDHGDQVRVFILLPG